MDQSLIQPRFYADTFGGGEYEMDVDENLGYRTPFLDIDSEKADTLFESILSDYKGSVVSSKKDSRIVRT